MCVKYSLVSLWKTSRLVKTVNVLPFDRWINQSKKIPVHPTHNSPFPLPLTPPQFNLPSLGLAPQAPCCATSGPPGAPPAPLAPCSGLWNNSCLSDPPPVPSRAPKPEPPTFSARMKKAKFNPLNQAKALKILCSVYFGLPQLSGYTMSSAAATAKTRSYFLAYKDSTPHFRNLNCPIRILKIGSATHLDQCGNFLASFQPKNYVAFGSNLALAAWTRNSAQHWKAGKCCSRKMGWQCRWPDSMTGSKTKVQEKKRFKGAVPSQIWGSERERGSLCKYKVILQKQKRRRMEQREGKFGISTGCACHHMCDTLVNPRGGGFAIVLTEWGSASVVWVLFLSKKYNQLLFTPRLCCIRGVHIYMLVELKRLLNTLQKKLAQLPEVDVQKLPGSFCCYSKIYSRLIQLSFDAQSLCILHSDFANTSKYANRWILDDSLAGACCMSTTGS
ncbi:hypothetical protein VP01_2361g2 [Puccinia sorghi]|uniref:Uncharacterized protein n=1 Tax=Puccinia sorghi TaxID=27349 RepID=A0A0L6V7C5_9BASI|nr:hypothetical protein VP01_2361g2 [Puccinia sorghi]